MKAFWQSFEKKDFKTAQQQFSQLSSTDQQAIFAELFQQSQYANTPHSVSVLFRELHDGKTFDDFHEAWFPPEDKCKPITEYGKTYQQLFQAPIRVINALNLNNPKEVVSVGIHWLSKEQGEHFIKMLPNMSQDDTNERRSDAIDEVAEHKQSGIFLVESDDNLGTPF
jgi:hypothetical protein